MAITFRDAAFAVGNGVTSASVAVPPLTQTADWMLEAACTSTGQTITNASAATALAGSPVTGSTELGYGWSKNALAGDLSSTVAFNLSASAKICAAIGCWNGVDAATPIHQIASATEAGTTLSHQMPAVTTTVDGCTIVYLVMGKDATTGVTTVLTPPSGATLRVQAFSGGTSAQWLGMAGHGGRPAGTYGGAGYTFDSNAAGTGQSNVVMYTIALRPGTTVGTQTSRPASVVTGTGFTAVPALSGGETLASRVGETVRDDATYVQSPANPTTQVVEFEETLLVDPGVGNRTNLVTDWVLSRSAGSVSSTFLLEVWQQGGGSALAAWTETGVTTTATNYPHTMTDPQIATINWSLPLRKRVTETVA